MKYIEIKAMPAGLNDNNKFIGDTYPDIGLYAGNLADEFMVVYIMNGLTLVASVFNLTNLISNHETPSITDTAADNTLMLKAIAVSLKPELAFK